MSTSIPVIDLSGHLSTSQDPSGTPPSASTLALAEEVVSAMTTYGFVFIKSTGLDFSASDVSTTFAVAREFFGSPRAEKEAVAMQRNNRGWTSMGSEVLDPETQKDAGDPKEAFNFGEFDAAGRVRQPLPRAFRDNEQQLARFSGLCYGLCLRLLELVAIGLKIESDGESSSNNNAATTTIDASWFSDRHDPSKGGSGTILRLLHYPASHGGARIRAGAHSDYGSMTLLFRRPGQAGLEILSPEGAWAPVPVQPDGTQDDPFPPILVNIGDLLSYWTGGLLKSTVHRVTGGEEAGGQAEDRQSIAFFCHPCRATRLVPVPSDRVRRKVRQSEVDKVGAGAGGVVDMARGQIITADEHLHSRLAATYGWNKEAVTA